MAQTAGVVVSEDLINKNDQSVLFMSINKAKFRRPVLPNYKIKFYVEMLNNVKIAAKSGVTKNIIDNSVIAGFPAVDIKKWKISTIKLNKL